MSVNESNTIKDEEDQSVESGDIKETTNDEDMDSKDSVDQIDSYLSNIAFPSTKEGMIEFVKTQNNGASFSDQLGRIPERTYESVEEVRSALNEFA